MIGLREDQEVQCYARRRGATPSVSSPVHGQGLAVDFQRHQAIASVVVVP